MYTDCALWTEPPVLFREGLRALLTAAPEVDVIREAATGDEAIAQALAQQLDVVLMDIHWGKHRPPR